MKIDKEYLIKNRFWVGLSAFGGLMLVGILLALFTLGDNAAKKEFDDAHKGIETALKAGPKTDEYPKPWEAHGTKFRNHKDVVWAQAWEVQKDMHTWPNPDRQGKLIYPERDFSLGERGRYAFTDYPTQFARLKTDLMGDPKAAAEHPDRRGLLTPVELAGGFEALVPERQWVKDPAPTREEIWLMQEDFCVRRELLYVVADALHSAARLHLVRDGKQDAAAAAAVVAAGVAGDPNAAVEDKAAEVKLPEGVVQALRYRNASWELTLMIERVPTRPSQLRISSTHSTIQNVHTSGRTQALANPRTGRGLRFKLTQGDLNPFLLEVAGEPLPAGGKSDFKQVKNIDAFVRFDFKKPFAVEQVYEWSTSPVRRVENVALAMPSQSHRTVTTALKPRPDLKTLDPDPTPAEGTTPPGEGVTPAPGGTAVPGGPGPKMPGVGTGVPGERGEGGMAAAAADATRINQIDRARYLHVTPQCRHLPVGLQLIVEGAHLHDVLTAVANSRLRIQITQVHLRHARGVSEGDRTGPGTGESGGRPEGTPFVPGKPRPPGPAVIPPGAAGPGEGPGGESTQVRPTFEDSATLFELTVYGIASLYEHYPPNPDKKPAAAAPPAQP